MGPYRKGNHSAKMAEFKPPEKEGVISMANSLAHTKWMCKYPAIPNIADN
jgi:hypothetical protein